MKDKDSTWLMWLVVLVVTLVMAFLAMGFVRWFNNQATSITVSEVESGVHCALATSTDGVAIDCWRVDDE